MKELVSIIIPAYQEEYRIERCLQSILNSTYHNLEIIVVNDGSTDHTDKIVENFKKKNESKTVSVKLINIPNGGAARARNCGLYFAKGDYIGFADADDMIHPQMIERLVESLRRGNELSICHFVLCNAEGKHKFYRKPVKREKRECPQQALEMIMWEKIQMSVWSVLFRRELIMDTEGKPTIFCPEDVVGFEDFAFICEYVSRCNGFIERIPYYGYFYCKHKGSLSTKRYTAEQLSYALQPVLAIGEKMNDMNFNAHKLQYSFRFMAYWYVEALRSSKNDFSPNCKNWKICMRELERYADIFMKAPNVAIYKKIAMWMVRRHPGIGWILAKTIGRQCLPYL